MDSAIDLGFPLWIRLTHLFMTLLIRSGIEILAAHPRLYFNEHCTPGTEWIRFTPRQMPEDQFWTGKDEQEAYSSWVSLPGGKHLGLGRQWHFLGVLGWLLTGLIYVVLLFVTPEWRRAVQQALQRFVDPVQHVVLHHLGSRQHYRPERRTVWPRPNGWSPHSDRYDKLASDAFAGWTLEVRGLVEQALRVTLADLANRERRTQVTEHNCIQGWSYMAEWTGVPPWAVLERCRPLPRARYVVLHAMDNKSESEPDAEGPGLFYETIDLGLARDSQTLLAYEMNGQRLSIAHGAPLRLRVETQLGFKMVKWLSAIELIESYEDVGEGQGGWREDFQHYSQDASI
jgi:methionine sulfoxide reductase catalytic subunit